MFIRNGRVTGSVYKAGLVAAGADPGALSVEEHEAGESAPEDRADGVHSVGGGWHEVVIDGQVIDKIRGAEAAQSAYDAYLQSDPDETDGDEVREDDGDDDTVSS